MRRPAKRRKRARRPIKRVAPGAPPGTLVADPNAPRPRARVIAYGPGEVHEEELDDPARIPELLQRWPVVWLDVVGLGDAEQVRRLGTAFQVHPLALEDVLNLGQRAKLEPYGEHQFLVLHELHLEPNLQTEQLSVFLGPRYVLTFQEREGDPLDPLRQRIRLGRGRVRECGADYLAYAIVDAVVDHYFPVLEQLSDRLEALEEEILNQGAPRSALEETYELKRELIQLRRAVYPLREVLGLISRGDVKQVTPETQLYFRDCFDHSFQILEVLESLREGAGALTDLYLNATSQRLNEVMMVLTVISTIFIPLSFLASLYGMNFDPNASPWNMPELRWRWGYPFTLGLMASVALGMLAWFRRRGWLGGGPPRVPPLEPEPEGFAPPPAR